MRGCGAIYSKFTNGKTTYSLLEFENCDNKKDIKYLWDGILKSEEELNSIGYRKVDNMKNITNEVIEKLNKEKAEYTVDEYTKNLYENEIWHIDQKLKMLNGIKERAEENIEITCTCGGTLKPKTQKFMPLHYIYGHVSAELKVELYECEDCKLKTVKVPEQIFRETKEDQEEYTKEVMKNVSIL